MAHPIREPPMIAPAGVAYIGGLPRIYDPTRFHNGSQQRYGAAHWPIQPGGVPQNPLEIPQNPFPFPQPPWFPNVNTNLGFHTLFKSPYSTKPQSVTATASRIQDLDGQRRLRVLRMSDEMAPRLSRYGQGVIFPGVPNTFQGGRAPLADRIEQAHAIHGLWLWYQSHCWPSRNDVVNGEPSVHDQVFKQVIGVMNLYIQCRYCNHQPPAPQFLQPNHEDREPRGYYPIWRRGVPVDHSNHNVDPQKAGFPDFVLTLGQQRTPESSAAVMEVKAFWSYDWESIKQIYSYRVAEFATGFFPWRGHSKSHKLLKQVWGEMVFFECKWGVWTNGEVFIFMIKSANTELTCSRPIHWTDPGAFTAMVGFTLASIDAKRDGNLLQWFVPDRHSHWPEANELLQVLNP